MKKWTLIFLLFLTIFTSVSFIIAPQIVSAETDNLSGPAVQSEDKNQGSNIISKILDFTNLPDMVNSFVGLLANLAMTAAGLVLSMAGTVLDVSIGLTLNIKNFVNATPAIFIVWKTLRDVTGLFFIFYLLYAAIQMMTGIGKTSYGATVKNIVIAGILINFSFFIVSVAIDASNIVSQALYNAMVPTLETKSIDYNTGITKVVEDSGKVGISRIFMNSLRIQSIYDVKGNKLGTNIANPVKIFLIGIIGVIMMLTTAASFIMAALAFIARLVILIFLLAFSSIWFAGRVIPEIDKHLKPFNDALYSQLVFMPIYLLLMYVALTIINGSGLLGINSIPNNIAPTGTNWVLPYIILGVNFAIVIFILNLPLAVGLSMGGQATSWMKKSMDKWDALKVWGRVGSGVSGFVGTHTAGWLASRTDRALSNTRLGNSAIGRSLRANTIGAIAKSKFGGAETYEDKTKAAKDRIKKGMEIKRKIEFNKVYNDMRAGIPPVIGGPNLKDALGKMSTQEKLALGMEKLKDINILKHLKSKDFEAIKENKDGLFTDAQIKEISDARYDALKDAVTHGEDKIVKDMVDEMDGKDLLKATKVELNNTSILNNPDVIKHMKTSQLQRMGDEGLDPTIKDNIKNEILRLGATGPTGHSAHSWIRRNWR